MAFDVKELVKQINIVDVISNFSTLTKAGASYKTLCNVHGDTSPSLSINPRKQIYKCFVCDHGGDALDYLIWSQKFSYPEAVKYIAKQAGIELNDFHPQKSIYNNKQLQLINCLNEANNLFKYYLNLNQDTDENLNKFIKKRKLDKNTITKFSLGFAPKNDEQNYLNTLLKKGFDESLLINASLKSTNSDSPFFLNRFIVPIFDEFNNIIAFAGRDIGDYSNVKYLHSSESMVFKKNNTIYNYNNAKNHEQLIIVEGFFDVMSLDKIGFDNSVALMGVGLTQNHINILKKHKEIILFLDNDEAGKKSTKNIAFNLIKHQINSSVVINESNYKDVDEIIDAGLLNEVNKMIERRVPSQIFIYEQLSKNVDKSNPNDLKNFFEEARQIWNSLDNYSKNIILKRIINEFQIDELTINEFLAIKNSVVLKYNNKLNRNNEERIKILTIDKILLALYKNPSLLSIQYLGNINWSLVEANKIKLFSEIKRFVSNNKKLSDESIKILEKYEKTISIYQIPKDESDLIELVNRHNNIDYSQAYISQTNNEINSKQNDDEKWDTLELKLSNLSKKIKE